MCSALEISADDIELMAGEAAPLRSKASRPQSGASAAAEGGSSVASSMNQRGRVGERYDTAKG
jgi:hypothetical protein